MIVYIAAITMSSANSAFTLIALSAGLSLFRCFRRINAVTIAATNTTPPIATPTTIAPPAAPRITEAPAPPPTPLPPLPPPPPSPPKSRLINPFVNAIFSRPIPAPPRRRPAPLPRPKRLSRLQPRYTPPTEDTTARWRAPAAPIVEEQLSQEQKPAAADAATQTSELAGEQTLGQTAERDEEITELETQLNQSREHAAIETARQSSEIAALKEQAEQDASRENARRDQKIADLRNQFEQAKQQTERESALRTINQVTVSEQPAAEKEGSEKEEEISKLRDQLAAANKLNEELQETAAAEAAGVRSQLDTRDAAVRQAQEARYAAIAAENAAIVAKSAATKERDAATELYRDIFDERATLQTKVKDLQTAFHNGGIQYKNLLQEKENLQGHINLLQTDGIERTKYDVAIGQRDHCKQGWDYWSAVAAQRAETIEKQLLPQIKELEHKKESLKKMLHDEQCCTTILKRQITEMQTAFKASPHSSTVQLQQQLTEAINARNGAVIRERTAILAHAAAQESARKLQASMNALEASHDQQIKQINAARARDKLYGVSDNHLTKELLEQNERMEYEWKSKDNELQRANGRLNVVRGQVQEREGKLKELEIESKEKENKPSTLATESHEKEISLTKLKAEAQQLEDKIGENEKELSSAQAMANAATEACKIAEEGMASIARAVSLGSNQTSTQTGESVRRAGLSVENKLKIVQAKIKHVQSGMDVARQRKMQVEEQSVIGKRGHAGGDEGRDDAGEKREDENKKVRHHVVI